MRESADDLPVLVIDGANFTDVAALAREFSRLLDGYERRGNLDAFNNIPRVRSPARYLGG